MLVFRRGTIVGVDAGGVAFDGRYTEETNNEITITLTVKAPPNIALIQGAVIGPENQAISCPIYHVISAAKISFVSTQSMVQLTQSWLNYEASMS